MTIFFLHVLSLPIERRWLICLCVILSRALISIRKMRHARLKNNFNKSRAPCAWDGQRDNPRVPCPWDGEWDDPRALCAWDSEWDDPWVPCACDFEWDDPRVPCVREMVSGIIRKSWSYRLLHKLWVGKNK